MRPFIALAFALAVLAGCGPTNAGFDTKMQNMKGLSESQLIVDMGMAPQTTHHLDDGSKILQWRWEKDDCVAEWRVFGGKAIGYRWTGVGCRSVAP